MSLIRSGACAGAACYLLVKHVDDSYQDGGEHEVEDEGMKPDEVERTNFEAISFYRKERNIRTSRY